MWEVALPHFIAPAVIAFFVSVVLGSVNEGSKRRQEFKLKVANRVREVLKSARLAGAAFRGSKQINGSRGLVWFSQRAEVLGLQAELVSEFRTLEALGFTKLHFVDNFCDALTGGTFENGSPDHNAVQQILNTAADLASAISDFEIDVVRRRILGKHPVRAASPLLMLG